MNNKIIYFFIFIPNYTLIKNELNIDKQSQYENINQKLESKKEIY